MTNGRRPGAGPGFTLIELLVVIAIIGMLAGMIFPVFARARESARRMSCISNLKNCSVALLMYAADNDDWFPYESGADKSMDSGTMSNPHLTLIDALGSYGGEYRNIWYCPVSDVLATYPTPNPNPMGVSPLTYANTDRNWAKGDLGYCYWSVAKPFNGKQQGITFGNNRLRASAAGTSNAWLMSDVFWSGIPSFPHMYAGCNASAQPNGLTVMFVDGHVALLTAGRPVDNYRNGEGDHD